MQEHTVNIDAIYNKTLKKKLLFIFAGLAFLLFLIIWSVSLGTADISIHDIFASIFGRILPFVGIETSSFSNIIVWELRLPRIFMAIIGGMGFALAGAAMQGIMRNPLVSPFTIGISSAAGFGASIAIVLSVGIINVPKYLIIGNAFLFAVLAAFLVYGIARLRGINSETLILAGIAIMYLFSALTSLLQYIATEHQLQGVVHWLFGNLSLATWDSLLIISVVVVLCFPFLVKYAWDLNALADGDETAISLGVNPTKVRIIVMILSTLITAVIVCFTGIIGFVCLVAPHITRMIVGNEHRFLLPCVCITGAILLLGSDTIGRLIIQPAELPVGIVTSFIGVPMFLYLLLIKRKRYWS